MENGKREAKGRVKLENLIPMFPIENERLLYDGMLDAPCRSVSATFHIALD